MKAICVILIVLLVTSCNHLTEGTVIGKKYEPLNSYTTLIPLVMSTGKTTVIIMTPYLVVDGEDFIVEIDGLYRGEHRTEYVYVSKKEYECLNIGSRFVVGEDCSTDDTNNTQTPTE